MEYNELYHIGVGHDENPPGRGSGRYEYGSGDNPEQHQFTLRSEVNRLVKDGYSKKDIAKMLLGQKGIDKQGNPIYYNTTDLRAQISIERTRERQMLRAKALELYEECDGSPTKIGRKMGLTESTVRSLLNESIAEKTDKYQNTADFLKKQIEEKGIIDISSDSELYMGTTAYTKNVAVSILEEQGYIKTYVKYPQMGTNNETTVMVLTAPPKEGETVKDVLRYVQQNKYNVKPIQEFTPDEGKTWWTPEFLNA